MRAAAPFLAALLLAPAQAHAAPDACVYAAGGALRSAPVQNRPTAEGPAPFVLENGRWERLAPPRYVSGKDVDWSDRRLLRISGRPYAAYGLPRVLGVHELALFAERDGVFIGKEAGEQDPKYAYVLSDQAECMFQPYVRIKDIASRRK